MNSFLRRLCLLVLLGVTGLALADEAVIRKNLQTRLPDMGKIDEVRKSELPGLFEVRVDGVDIYYTDAQANYLIEGNLIDTRSKRNLTEERVDKLTAIKFEALPLKDAFVVVRGKGERKLAVFEDPNCGYCKRFERDLQKVDNVTIYMFLFPVLGADSMEKSKAIWCAKDRGAAWLDWMLREQAASAAPASCDAGAVVRNAELGRKHKITGTPTLIFSNSTRVPGAIDNKRVEQLLAQAAKP
ncbi:MAG: DsbC family protein [Betaproteobacteria bacterium]|jgi:thiol:disulfide interchange protein DsbC